MKKVKFLVGFLAIALLFVLTASAQDKSKLTPLAANATLTETQSWLVNALQKNSSLTDAGRNTSVRYKTQSVEISGCQLSLSRKIKLSTASSTVTSFDIPYSGSSYDHINDLKPDRVSRNSYYREVNMDFRLKNLDLVEIKNHHSRLATILLDARKANPARVGHIFVTKKDSAVITAGFNQLAALCSAQNTGK